MNTLPPTWAKRLLQLFAAPDTLEEVDGDLLEMYAYWANTVGIKSAQWKYVVSVFKLLRPFAKSKASKEYPRTFLFSHVMIRNYFQIAFRNLVKNKGYSFINIGGLAVGMSVAMLNGLWLWDEFSFDKYHQNFERIAQITERGITGDKKPYSQVSLPYPVAHELRSGYGQYFKHILLATEMADHILKAGETKLTKTGQFIEAGAPDMLTLKMLKGSRAGLSDPHTVLLSQSTATALFGDADPLNKLIKIDAKLDARVTGVYEDLPHNTKFHNAAFFAPFDLWTIANPWIKEQQWDNWFLNIYAEIKPGVNFEQVSAIVKDIEINNLKKLDGRTEQLARNPMIHLLPMREWHLSGGYDMTNQGPKQMVWLVGFIGLFVLLLACINFMNLSTARSEKRAKEVGIRKAVGSVRGQLISQFFSESFLVVGLAFVVALFLTLAALHSFNEIAAKQMTIPWSAPHFWLGCLSFILFTGFIAGSYPAFYLSSFQPVKVLKGGSGAGSFRLGKLTVAPRKILVIIQFTVSVTLIISTTIVYRQLQYAKNRPIGYSRQGLILLKKSTDDFDGKRELLRSELKNTGVVYEVAESRSSVTGITMWNAGFSIKAQDIPCPRGCGTLSVTPEYGRTVGWEFLGGRDFSRDFSSDSAGLVINESFAKSMGMKNPVGEVITWAPTWRKPETYTILGVVKDMVSLSPYESTIPTVFLLEDFHNWINIRINPHVSAAVALPQIEAVFKKLVPSAPFDYKFADQEYALKFAAEERIGKLAAIFASLAILISCLGLFGLASFTAEQRTREIGVRKVLGASVLSLWSLISKDFVFLVLIGFLIATPLGYYLLDKWLQNYTYRTEISWWIFVLAGIAALLITLLTVSFQAIKAALLNPVKSLRSE